MARAFSFLFCAAMFVSACGGGGGDGGPDRGGDACAALYARTAPGTPQVFNGQVCSQVKRTAVVAIVPVIASGEQLVAAGICSGTLVTVDDILTSAHCFTEPYNSYGDQIAGFFALVGGAAGDLLFINKFAIHPFYDGSTGTPYDIAMATVESVPNPPIGPLPILISEATLPGQDMSTFGYGTNNRGEVGTLKAAELTIQGIEGGNLLASFETSGSSICGGDSGGPVVQVLNGVTTIVGVNSFGLFVEGQECPTLPAIYSGFVDLQNRSVLEFIAGYAPDVPAI